MKKIATLILLLIAVALNGAAQYSLYDFYGNVTLQRGGKSIAIEKGMKLNATDQFNIGDNSGIEILNSMNSQIFRSTSKGSFTTTRIMIDAKDQATDHRAAIHDKIRFGKSATNGDDRVYVEKGLVRRSMETYDPEAENLQVDIKKLSVSVYNALKNPEQLKTTDFPVNLLHASVNDSGLKFMLENTLSFPVYFNVLRIMPEEKRVEISELGQPTGNYVVLSDQSIVRSQSKGLKPDGKHILIMTHCYFDIDELIENIESLMKEGSTVASDTHLPVYLRAL